MDLAKFFDKVQYDVLLARVSHKVHDKRLLGLMLVVNHQKSRTCSTDGVEFLGFTFRGYGGQIHVGPKKIK